MNELVEAFVREKVSHRLRHMRTHIIDIDDIDDMDNMDNIDNIDNIDDMDEIDDNFLLLKFPSFSKEFLSR
jgi:hypothetical protein